MIAGKRTEEKATIRTSVNDKVKRSDIDAVTIESASSAQAFEHGMHQCCICHRTTRNSLVIMHVTGTFAMLQ